MPAPVLGLLFARARRSGELLSGPISLTLALVALAATLGAAMARRPHLEEWLVAAVGALVLVALGAVELSQAAGAVRELAPTVGFLAALLLIAEGCRRDGLFKAVGVFIARRAGRNSQRLLVWVFAAASAVTIVLGLDATVVLLTPIVLATASRSGARSKASVYACAHLANSASLLLPVSNLTNLLAFRASGLSFTRFAALMLFPTLAAVTIDWIALSRWRPIDGVDLTASPPAVPKPPSDDLPVKGRPRFAVTVVVLTLVGFALSSPLGIQPVWFAIAGALAINLPAIAEHHTAAVTCMRATQPGFLMFVLGLGVIVAAAGDHGLSSGVEDLLPGGSSLPDLLLIAAVSAILANLVNNLPATLIILPVSAHLGSGAVLATLIGVNVGPNLTHVGSLATLLWRRVLQTHGIDLKPREFVALGSLTVPPALLAATTLLWLALKTKA